MDMHHYIFGRLCSESTFLCCCSTARLELVRKTHTNSMAATLHAHHSSRWIIFLTFCQAEVLRLAAQILQEPGRKHAGSDSHQIWIGLDFGSIGPKQAGWFLHTSLLPDWFHLPPKSENSHLTVMVFELKLWSSDPVKNPVWLWWSLNWNHDLLISSYEIASKQHHRNITIII